MPDGRWKVGARVFTGKTRDANLRGHIPWTTGTITEVRDAHGLGLQYKVRHDIHVGDPTEATLAWYGWGELTRLPRDSKVAENHPVETEKVVSRFERF